MAGFAFDDDNNPKRSRFRGFQEIKKLFRIAEIIILLSLLTWTLTRLPLAVRISVEYLRWIVNIVVSHLFVFFLTNAIVLILFLKSRTLFLHHDLRDGSEIHVDFFQEINGGEAEEIVYQDKQTILEVTKVRVRKSRRERSDLCEKPERRRVEEEAAEVVDGLSSEEFQRAIEAFIAKQIKFHQQEKLAIVVHGCL